MKKEGNPQIGLTITSKGVGGCTVFGKTLKERQNSLALLNLLEPDLIQVQDYLNQRITLLLSDRKPNSKIQ
jgi:hypothetical protein